MNKKPILFVLTISLIFLLFYSLSATPIKTSFDIDHRFDWPDETANYFWTKNYAADKGLVYPEILNQEAENQIHPRSINVRQDGSLVPGSFLGLIILFGTLAKIFGLGVIVYLTPIFSILGVLAFYGIIKKIFDQNTAALSAVILMFHPAWWYYSSTTMLPNVTFVSCILISVYFLLKTKKERYSPIITAAVFTGLAVSIRPVEIVWLTVLYLVVLIYNKNNLDWKKLLIFFAISLIAFAPSIYQQKLIYGDYLATGYTQLHQVDQVCQSCQVVKSILLPFGFHPKLAFDNFWINFVSNFFWLVLLTLLGLIAYVTKKRDQKNTVYGYLLLSLFIFGWLMIYYGSWQFDDIMTMKLNTLGLSYVRYWLPLYVLATPFTAIGILWLVNFLKKKISLVGLFIAVFAIFYFSAGLVLEDKADSLNPVRQRIFEYKQNAHQVFGLTEEHSVIITSRKDKLFFPDRRVIHSFDSLNQNEQLLSILPQLIDKIPVYYYALDIEEIDSDQIDLEFISDVGFEKLYKVIRKNDQG